MLMLPDDLSRQFNISWLENRFLMRPNLHTFNGCVFIRIFAANQGSSVTLYENDITAHAVPVSAAVGCLSMKPFTVR